MSVAENMMLAAQVRTLREVHFSYDFTNLNCIRQKKMLSALPLSFVFRFTVRDCLPLHVAGRIRAAALQWSHMVNDVAGAPTARSSGRWASFMTMADSTFFGSYARTWNLWSPN